MKQILIIGQNGQLASAITKRLTLTSCAHKTLSSKDINLVQDPSGAVKFLGSSAISAVINTAAFTNVDAAESQQSAAFNLNAEAPRLLAEACAERGLPFIHISSDYVFNGQEQTPYKPIDLRSPINVYGQSKALGEDGVMAAGGQSLILRTSWLYDGIGKNFLTTMLKLAQEQDSVCVVHDQTGRPTYAGHLAEACLMALTRMPTTPKIYNVSNTGDIISWADFAREIFNQAEITCSVRNITTAEFPRDAARPSYSAMDVSDFEKDFDHAMPDWKEGLKLALTERL